MLPHGMQNPIKLPLAAAMASRRAERHFHADPLPPGMIEDIVGMANHTPSGFNICPIRVVACTTESAREALRKACYNQPQVTESPASLVVLGNRKAWEDWPAQGERLVEEGVLPSEVASQLKGVIAGFFGHLDEASLSAWIQRQGGLYSMSLMIAVESLGLNSCPMEGFIDKAVRDVVGVGDDYETCLVLPIGKGTGEKADWGRPDMSEILSFETLS